MRKMPNTQYENYCAVIAVGCNMALIIRLTGELIWAFENELNSECISRFHGHATRRYDLLLARQFWVSADVLEASVRSKPPGPSNYFLLNDGTGLSEEK